MTKPGCRAGFETALSETEGMTLGWVGAPPRWLTGCLLRAGPARFEVGGQSYLHWFDGLAMLYRFEMTVSGAFYSNRFLRSETFKAAERAGAIARDEFATTTRRPLWSRLFGSNANEMTDNANVNVVTYGADDFVALTETPHPVRFDPHTLETTGGFRWRDDLGSQLTTAHPLHDADRGLIYNLETEFGRSSVYRFTSTAVGSRHRTLVAELAAKEPAWVHSFGMSENHLVLAEFPLVTQPLRFLLTGKSFFESLRWRPERGLRFTIVEKDTGAIVRRAETEPCFGFHLVNAFEQAGDVVLDLVAYPDASVVRNLYLDRLRSVGARAIGVLTRFRVPLGSGPALREQLSAVPLEMPRFDDRRRGGRAHRYVWAIGQAGQTFMDRISKYDVETGAIRHWSADGAFPGEPVFVAAPDGEAEDDGVILSVVLDAARARSFLVVLDAATLEERARAIAPHAIPFDFHGNYFSDLAHAA